MAHTSQFCTFYLDKLLFGVELKGVQEVIRTLEMTKVPLAPEVVSGLINLRGQIVTAVDLRRRLELEPAPPGYADHERRGAIGGWRGQPAGRRNWRCSRSRRNQLRAAPGNFARLGSHHDRRSPQTERPPHARAGRRESLPHDRSSRDRPQSIARGPGTTGNVSSRGSSPLVSTFALSQGAPRRC